MGKKRKKLTIQELIDKIKELVYKRRAPIMPTKVVRDKRKYTRKKKHRKQDYDR